MKTMKKITTQFEVVPVAVALQTAKLFEDEHVEEDCIEKPSSSADVDAPSVEQSNFGRR